jgi:hypothetical protein
MGAYEFNRAICNIKLATSRPERRTLDQQIKKDLEAVCVTTSRFADIARLDPEVQKWLGRARQGELGFALSPGLTDLIDTARQ